MNTDLSVAPEIAQLAAPLLPVQQAVAAPRTDGRIAGDLAALAAAPQGWWDLVRFDPAGPVRIPVPGAPGAWLLVLPPDTAADCDCGQATALAGEAVELAADGTAAARCAPAASGCTAPPRRTGCAPPVLATRSRCIPCVSRPRPPSAYSQGRCGTLCARPPLPRD